MKDTALTIPESQPLATREPSIGLILSEAIKGGISKENVEVVKELIAMQRQMRAEEAQRDFAAAFAKLQAECAPVKASKQVPDNSGGVRYTYAPYEEVMRQVTPLLREHGFAVTFDTDILDGRVIATCTLIHIGGHSRSNKFACRIGSGPPKSSEAQGDGAATTYAKRFALCAALNIVVETDSDARNEGDTGTIMPAQAESLKSRCMATKPITDLQKFLKLSGAASFEEIPVGKYAMLDNVLRGREAKTAAELHTEEQKF
jgi:hypothetical protein